MRIFKVLEKIKEKFAVTEREFEIMILMVKGFSTLKELSSELKISSSTINNHLDNIYRKFNITGKGELLSFVIGELIEEIDRLENAVDFTLIDSDAKNQIWIYAEEDEERNQLVSQSMEYGYFINPFKSYAQIMERMKTLKKPPSATVVRVTDLKGVSVLIEGIRQKFGKRHPFILVLNKGDDVDSFSSLIGPAGYVYYPAEKQILQSMLEEAIGQASKRKESRIPVGVSLQFWEPGHEAEKIETKTTNISFHGFSCALATPINKGDVVDFKLTFNQKVLEGVAQVVWLRKGDGSYAQCGFRITNFAKGFEEYSEYVKARDLGNVIKLRAA